MKGINFFALLAVSEKAVRSAAIVSTKELAKMIDVSQQTASRVLRSLEVQGLVERKMTPKGASLKVTAEGFSLLKSIGTRIGRAVGKGAVRELCGKVCNGLGEGSYYTSQPNYLTQFKEKLGFTPFRGTLNLAVEEHESKAFLHGIERDRIDGFKTGERSFGAIDCYPVRINSRFKGAIIVPKRSSLGGGVIEVISNVFLRKKLRLEEGSEVVLSEARE